MTGSRISTTVTQTVLLDSQNYASPLTVTASGVIDVTQDDGADGIMGAQAGDKVTNRGAITAATGSSHAKAMISGAGGVGIDLTATGTIINSGTIAGGYGGYTNSATYSGAGGNAIDAISGRITNSGTIFGGDSGDLGKSGGAVQNGGIGVDVSGAGLVLNNSGTIGGGGSYYGVGGAGVDFALAGTLKNTGSIFGGLSQDHLGGVGVALASGCDLVNKGKISGGFGGAGLVATSSHTTNDGTITGGQGFTGYRYVDTAGGDGVSLNGGVLTNDGLISGGAGTYPFEVYGPSPGGVGVVDSHGSLVNNGTIEGGSSFTDIGRNYGVVLQSGASLTNHGTVLGGSGAYNSSGYGYSSGGDGLAIDGASTATNSGLIQGGSGIYRDGSGGVGVTLASGGVLDNTGTLAGGAGGAAYQYEGRYVGGFGGDGAIVSSGAMLTNAGTIIGGDGGTAGSRYGIGYGGAGVQIQGGTLVTSGTIIGGADLLGSSMGDAVQFTGAGTLVVEATAVFKGSIVADPSVSDTLVLAGNEAGTLSGFGTTVTGLTTISEDAHEHWTLAGDISGTGSVVIGTGAYLALTEGTVSIASIVFGAGGNETLYFGAPDSVSSTFSGFGAGDRIGLANVQAASLSFSNGTLTLFDASHHAVDMLTFAGSYTIGDFSLQQEGKTTEVVYSGSHDSALPHLPDFMPMVDGRSALLYAVEETIGTHVPVNGPPGMLVWLHH